MAVTVVSYVTAGIYLQTDRGGAEELHGVAAIGLHMTTGLLAVGLAALARSTKRGWWAAGLAAAPFAYTFAQAALADTLAFQVTGAFVVTVVPVALLAWLSRSPASSAAHTA